MSAAVACGVGLSGCGPAPPPRVPVHPVRGELHIGGKPAVGAVVVFHPVADPAAPPPRATVAADGSFRPQFYEDADGIPAGEYALTVTWRESATGMSPDRLKGRHSEPGKPVVRVTVKPGDNVIDPIRLRN